MKKLKKLGKLTLMSEKMLPREELVNFRGGSWDGRCGTKEGGIWYCQGETYADVTWKYEIGTASAWCCASCSDEDKCGPGGLD